MPETIVEWKPRPRNRVFIRLSGGRFFTIPQPDSPVLKAGSTLSERDIDHLSRIDQYHRGRDKALRLIGIRQRTRHEIRGAMDKLGILPAIRDGIIGELEEQGLIDDRRFAREFVRSRVELRRLGPHRLRFELGRHGVPEAIVDGALAEEISAESQERVARDVVARQIGAKVPDERDVRRLSTLLRRKGFDYEIINQLAYELLARRRAVGRDIDE